MKITSFARFVALGGIVAALGLFNHTASAAVACLNANAAATSVCNVRLDVGSANLVSNGFTGPYATGSITRVNGRTFDFSMTATTQVVGGHTYEYRIGELDFNLNRYNPGLNLLGFFPFANASVSNVNVTGQQFLEGVAVDGNGDVNMGGFGNFNVGVDTTGLPLESAAARAFSSISFRLTFSNSVTAFSDVTQLLNLNADNHSAAGSIYVFDPSRVAFLDFGYLGTGLVMSGNAAWPCDNEPSCGASVPEPKPLALLGLGLMALIVVRRRYYGEA